MGLLSVRPMLLRLNWGLVGLSLSPVRALLLGRVLESVLALRCVVKSCLGLLMLLVVIGVVSLIVLRVMGVLTLVMGVSPLPTPSLS